MDKKILSFGELLLLICPDAQGEWLQRTKGKDLKNAGVIYDRNGSSFSEPRPGNLDWDEILTGISRLHFSAISPALNALVAAVCEEAVKAAVTKKIPVSVDLNYRAKLWQYGKQPVEVMPELVSHYDLVMGNIARKGSSIKWVAGVKKDE